MNLILGGTRGLGAEIAKKIQEKSEKTFVVGSSYEQTRHGQGLKIDLAEESKIQKLTDYLKTIDENKPLNFFWVAGYGYIGDFSAQPDVLKMAKVNFSNVLPIAQMIWNKMLNSNQDCKFVVISSTTGVKPRKDEAVYAATKHAQVGFARSLGLESERLNSKVKVALFMPGGMQTTFWEGSEPSNINEFLDPAKVAQRIIERIDSQTNYFYEETIERGSL